MKGNHHDTTLMERFWMNVSEEPMSGCWLWLGFAIRGYPGFNVGRRVVKAHRFSYQTFVGPIPAGLVLDHKCRVPMCVNPEHLRPVTDRENILIGFGLGALNARKTHCKRGHEFTPENTAPVYNRSGRIGRGCRTCSNAANRIRRKGLRMLKRFGSDARAVTMLEWAMIAALVAIVAVSTLSVLGRSVSSEFSKVQAAMSPVKPSAT